MLSDFSARIRIVLLVFASTLPILGLTLYVGVNQRNAAEAAERRELQQIAQLTAKRPEMILEGVRQLLFAVSGNIEYLMKDFKTCDTFFRKLSLESGEAYRNLGVILPNGDVFCNTATAHNRPVVNVSDRYYFRLAMESKRFAVGEYQVGRATKSPGLNLAYPVLDTDGSVRAVLFVGLNLDAFIEPLRQRSAELTRVMTLFDRKGIVLAQQPEFRASVGQKSPNPQVLAQMEKFDRGLFTATDLTGKQRLYAVENVGMNPDGVAPIRLVVSTPQDMIFADSNRALIHLIVGVLVVALAVLLLAWLGAEVFVLRRFRALLEMAEKVRGGDFGARSGIGGGREELSRLGAALDAMAEELQQRDRQLQEALHRLNQMAATDQLTGLPNRRYLWEALGAELMRSRRKQTPLAVMLLDIDHFKDFNDRWGHEAGDLVLKNVTYAIRAVVRGSDIVARHGGEEFVVVLPEADRDIALARAEAVRREIAGLQLTYGGRSLGNITASIGIALSRELHETPEGMVRIADLAMYEAKQSGRNRVVIKNADVITNDRD